MPVVHAPPEGFPVPDFMTFRTEAGDFDVPGYQKAEEDYLKRLCQYLKEKNPKDTLAGTIGYFPMGDGAAIYIVAKRQPLTLVHVPIGDAWRLPGYSERGLRAADFQRQHAED